MKEQVIEKFMAARNEDNIDAAQQALYDLCLIEFAVIKNFNPLQHIHLQRAVAQVLNDNQGLHLKGILFAMKYHIDLIVKSPQIDI
jgi:hypothetical protein